MEQMLEAGQNVASIFSGLFGGEPMGARSLFFSSCLLVLRAGCRRFCGRICVGDGALGALLALLEGLQGPLVRS